VAVGPELVASMRSNKITRIDPPGKIRIRKSSDFLQQCQQRIQDFIRATLACGVAIELRA